MHAILKSAAIVIAVIFVIGPVSHSVYAQAERSKAYGLLIDNTGSLVRQFDQVKLFSERVVDQVHKQGPVQLFSFKWTGGTPDFVMTNSVQSYEGANYDRAIGTLGVDWTQDAGILARYIEGLAIVRGQTDLFGAIRSVAESLNTPANPKDAPWDKIVILITDGEHRMEMIGSQPTETEDERNRRDSKLREYLKDSGIKVFAIGLTGDLDTGENRRLRAENYLSKLTKDTGGRVVFSRSKRPDIDKLVNQLLAP